MWEQDKQLTKAEEITVKKQKKIYNNNLYLFIQIICVAIVLTAGIMLKIGNNESYEYAKQNYSEFFKSENVAESNFSYESFLENFAIKLKEQHLKFIETISRLTGKGSSEIYPSNSSLKKYKLSTPAVKPFNGYISSPFGLRKNPFNVKKNEFHTGVDIAAEKGTFIKSCFSGTVLKAEFSNTAGNYIIIKTDEEITCLYAHNQFLFVKEGDYVMQGQVISTVGATGLVTGPHLHLELILNRVKVNPIYAFNDEL